MKHAVSVELNKVNGAITSSDGDLWLATSQGAIRYDGVDVTTYTIADGFLVDDLRDVHEDHWGNLWFATWGGGVVRYDGDSFQSVTTKDGLIHNNVSSIQASNEERSMVCNRRRGNTIPSESWCTSVLSDCLC